MCLSLKLPFAAAEEKANFLHKAFGMISCPKNFPLSRLRKGIGKKTIEYVGE